MSVCAVIAEYDPFHNGHAWQIRQIKKAHPEDTLLIILSDVFTERGTPALFSPHLRAKAALSCGADGVVLLPAPFCCMGASLFGSSGVEIAKGIGADTLIFGAECTDRDRLCRITENLEDAIFLDRLSALSKERHDAVSFARKKETAYKELTREEDVPLLREPNCILAFEYIKALKKYGMQFEVLPRMGVSHNDKEAHGDFASASFLRELIEKGEDIDNYCPAPGLLLCREAIQAGELACFETGAPLILGLLSRLSPLEIEQFGDIPHGMGARLHRAAVNQNSLPAFFEAVATKKYTNARIRRMILAVLGEVTPHQLHDVPHYTLLLGANEKGCAHFRRLAKETDFPVLTKPAGKNMLSAEAKEQFIQQERFKRLYRLFQRVPSAPSKMPVILK